MQLRFWNAILLFIVILLFCVSVKPEKSVGSGVTDGCEKPYGYQ